MLLSKELTAASATPLALSIIAQGDNYGYAIIKAVLELSDGELEWTEGMLYPVLHRLESDGFVLSSWRGDGARKRKYYSITKAGLDALAAMKTQWRELGTILEKGWALKGGGGCTI